MWHASIAAFPEHPANKDTLRMTALATLQGVGDERLGQWEEWTGKTYQIKRRLARKEQHQVGTTKDIRNTPEQCTRQLAVKKYLPEALKDWND